MRNNAIYICIPATTMMTAHDNPIYIYIYIPATDTVTAHDNTINIYISATALMTADDNPTTCMQSVEKNCLK